MAHIKRQNTRIRDTPRAARLYFNWLCQLMYIDDYNGNTYYDLAHVLHKIEFYSVIPLDENRAKDGLRLRDTWLLALRDEAEELGLGCPNYGQDFFKEPCSVFEMLVALAVRLESDIMQDDSIGPRAHLWFWAMLHNIGLDEFHDYASFTLDDVTYRVNIVLDRVYNPDGSGGLFPLKEPTSNQMFVDIWWQGQAWLRENYGI